MVIIYRYLSNQNSFFPYQNEVMKLHNFWVQIYILKIQILWFMPHSIQQSLRLFICFLVICKVVVFRISYFCSCIFFSSRDLVDYWAHKNKMRISTYYWMCVYQLFYHNFLFLNIVWFSNLTDKILSITYSKMWIYERKR